MTSLLNATRTARIGLRVEPELLHRLDAVATLVHVPGLLPVELAGRTRRSAVCRAALRRGVEQLERELVASVPGATIAAGEGDPR